MTTPDVTVVVTNHNGGRRLLTCLQGVVASRGVMLDVVIVDNGSTDGSVQHALGAISDDRLAVIWSAKNLGNFSGLNRGAAGARGRYLMFLDNDVIVDPECLATCIAIMDASGAGAAQARLVLSDPPGVLDGCGHFISPVGLVWEVHSGMRDAEVGHESAVVMGAKSAAMITSRALFERLGGFDPGYFMTWAETDYCWRVWLAGSQVLFLGAPRAVHNRGSTPGPMRGPRSRSRLGPRNGIWTLFKNLEVRNLGTMLPMFVTANLALAGLMASHGRSATGAQIVRGVVAGLRGIPRMQPSRASVQRELRTVSDSEILPVIRPSVSFRTLLNRAPRFARATTSSSPGKCG